MEKWQAAVRADEELLQNMLDRFGVREVTLIDVLLTEENATRDAIQLIAQRQAYQSILARLKFETGELVTFESDDSSIRNYRFDSSILVGR